MKLAAFGSKCPLLPTESIIHGEFFQQSSNTKFTVAVDFVGYMFNPKSGHRLFDFKSQSWVEMMLLFQNGPAEVSIDSGILPLAGNSLISLQLGNTSELGN